MFYIIRSSQRCHNSIIRSIKLSITMSRQLNCDVNRLVENHERHLFDYPSVLNVYSKDFVNLSVGAPGPDVLRKCIQLFDKSTQHALAREAEDAYLFQYGPTAGLWECRENLAQFLSHNYGDTVYKEDLVLTCGATHGLLLTLITFLHPEGIIFVDEFTYMIALSSFKQFPGMKIIKVPFDGDTIDLKFLENLAIKEKSSKSWNIENKPFWAMFYTIPIFHNPTGVSLPPDRCENLIKLARELDILIFCDDVYNLLHYDDAPVSPKRLFAYDRELPGYRGGHVISNGSFSKILGPGVRLGWLELPARLAKQLRESGIMRSGGGVNNYVSGVIASALELGLQQDYLNNLINTLKERMNTACDCLETNLPAGCSFKRPVGGYFIWVRLPANCNAEDALKWCQEKHKVCALAGPMFSPDGGSGKNCMRLAISFHPVEKLRNAIQRLCQGLDEYLKENP